MAFRWIRRIRMLVGGARVERAMRDEMTHHLDCEIADRVKAGMAPDEARRTALVDFGGLERFKEEGRDARGLRLLHDLFADARYAWRVAIRSPAFTVSAMLTLALGIGAVTAIFSVVYGVVLRPLPYADPSRLVAVWERSPSRPGFDNVVAVRTFEAWRDRARSLSGLAALVPQRATILGRSGSERVAGAAVSPGYFGVLGVAPALGREFTAAEAGAPVVMLSDAYWRRRFAADPSVLGQALEASGTTYTIVGVMPAGFDPPQFNWLGPQELWFPFGETAANRSWGRFLLVVGRLRPGVGVAEASREVGAIALQIGDEYKQTGWTAFARGLKEQISGDVRPALLVLQAAACLLFIMAATNVAVLLLTHLERRSSELALRRAIGAGAGRVFRQVFTQSALVGALGGGIGLWAAAPLVSVLHAWLPADMPRAGSVGLDSTVVSICALAALAAAVACGAGAAWRAVRSSHGMVGQASARVSARSTRGWLVISEVAVGLVVTVLASLMIRSVSALQSVDLGFVPDAVVAGRVAAFGPGYESGPQQRRFFDRLLESTRATPGVVAASLIDTRPFGGQGPATSIRDPRQPASPTDIPIVADVRTVDPDLFRTLQIPFKSGATFDGHDEPDAPPRIVVNEFLARTLFGSENPIGRRVAVAFNGDIEPEIIGVVADTHLEAVRIPVRSTVYLSATRYPSEVFDLVVRTDRAPDAIVPELRRNLKALDPSLPLYLVDSLRTMVDAALARDRFTLRLLLAFAGVSLALAAIGIYGVFDSDVARRRREMGIRLLLGARRTSVVWIVVRSAMTRAAIGVAAGAIAAMVAARFMGSLLFGVGPSDAVALGGTALLLIVLALAATLAPSLEAGRLSPTDIVRGE